MSFTFDDIGKPTPESDTFKINELSERIAELKFAATVNPSSKKVLDRQISQLETVRRGLSDRQIKAAKVAGRAAAKK